MDSALISKVFKARRYAEERARFTFTAFSVRVEGDNGVHVLQNDNGRWSCDCGTFRRSRFCSHTMATEQLLADMLPAEPAA